MKNPPLRMTRRRAGATHAPDPQCAPLRGPIPEPSFSLVFESASIGMAIVGLDNRYLRVNRALCDLLGYEPDEFLGVTFLDLTHPEDRARDILDRHALIEGAAQSVQRNKRYIAHDGSVVWTLRDVTLLRNEMGQPMYFLTQMTEITGLVHAQQELRKQATELQALNDTTMALLDRQHPDDVLTRIVKSAAELAGTEHGYVYAVDEESEALVVRVGIGLFSDSVGYRLARGEGIAGRAWDLARTVRADDYRDLPLARAEWSHLRAVLAVPMVIRDRVIGVIGLAHPDGIAGRFTTDHELALSRFGRLAAMVLENARYERDLEDLNRELRSANEIKDHFVAMVSHELRTPLTNVMGFTKTLIERWASIDDDERLRYIDTIDRNSERLDALVSDLLMTSRIESGALDITPERLCVCEAIQAAIATVPGAGQVKVECTEGLEVFADPMRVEQILVNYLSNALRHGAPPVRILARASGGGVVIMVTDHGAGVPKEFRARLFERFAQADSGLTRRTHGTGLGLSIVRALARAMGGDAWYEPGTTGSCFGVRLPSPTEGRPRR